MILSLKDSNFMNKHGWINNSLNTIDDDFQNNKS